MKEGVLMDARKILLKAGGDKAIKIQVATVATWPKIRAQLPRVAQAWAEAQNFTGSSGTSLQVPDGKGAVAEVILGSNSGDDGFHLARLYRQLPRGSYAFKGTKSESPKFAELAWCLEAYNFARYKANAKKFPSLVCSPHVDYEEIVRLANATYLVRDLINTPSNDFGPDELESAARKVASRYKAKFAVVRGESLKRRFPMVHEVGKASPRHPRLIDFSWGSARAPKVTLVGKGVCFDTGGLDIKPASGMALMKKDMGGAANVLGLAQMIMDARLPVRLRVLIPAVENSIAGNAFRPGDILKSRKGLTVEIGNTDAEGRLVLGDALALADEETPDLLIDMATLTGSARVALGPDLPPFYTSDEKLAGDVTRHAEGQRDPLWRMPFWEPYYALFESPVADMNNSADTSFAGSITAALFLKRFVEKAKSYLHLDIYGWTPTAKPGFPKGGEAQGIRALFSLISERYKK
ncbi:MAG: leucyl aminopeptidase family protein [Aestuariivirga sp.]|nr:leucyl aminopeptidase family protein [Aestuariivirga sp.]